MLSESTRPGGVDYSTLVLPALHARGPAARRIGVIAGGAVLLLVVLMVPLLPPDLPLVTVMLLPVLGVTWYGGRWAGVWAAFAASGGRLLMDLATGAPYSAPSVTFWNFIISLLLYLLAARVVPVLRETVYRDRELATTDPLTTLGNRRFFSELAAIELNRTRRYKRPLALVYLNLDAFEKFNERFGYAEGDALLVLLASVIRGRLRTSDVVARIAGDEFAVLLPETGTEGARVAAGKIRQNLADAVQRAGYAITFSMAVIAFEEGPVTLEGLLRQADALMASIKREGGDAIQHEVYEHTSVPVAI